MYASPVITERMALLKQCAEDRARVVCQYDADGFERILHLFNLTNIHPLLVQHLRNGFPMARNPLIPLPSFTFLPLDHLSASDTPKHKSFVIVYLKEECLAWTCLGGLPRRDCTSLLWEHLVESTRAQCG